MVRVIYDGNLGNNLFQYAFGRLLAMRLNYQLFADPIPGFPGTHDDICGKTYSTGRNIILRGQKPDLSFLEDGDPKCEIILTGYFQRAEYYEPYADEIRTWLRLDYPLKNTSIKNHDVVIGVRRGRDYIPRHGLPLSYFDDAAHQFTGKTFHICSDTPSDPFVKYLAKRYSAVVRQSGALDNMAYIARFSNIVISNSTFLWWAAFLSDAEKIIFPRPFSGFWSSTDPVSKNISLEVSDSRYIYLECAPYVSEFIGEILQNQMNSVVTAAKGAARRMGYKRTISLGEPAPWTFHED